MTRSIKLAAAVVLAVSMSGCAVQKDLVATGGSRSDGTVRMSFELGLFEVPKIDVPKTINAASQRCQAWGYDRAEPFGGETRVCNAVGVYGDCMQWLVTVEFQCLADRPAAADAISARPAPVPTSATYVPPTTGPTQ